MGRKRKRIAEGEKAGLGNKRNGEKVDARYGEKETDKLGRNMKTIWGGKENESGRGRKTRWGMRERDGGEVEYGLGKWGGTLLRKKSIQDKQTRMGSLAETHYSNDKNSLQINKKRVNER